MPAFMRSALVVLALLGCPAMAERLYEIKDLPEPQLLEMYQQVLIDASRHSDRFYTVSTFDSSAGYWGNGISDGNEGIRAVGEMVLTCATLLKYSNRLSAGDREHYTTQTVGALRYAVATHRTGSQKCPDGKQWGGSWQSAMWTATAAFGAWLIWDQLDVALQKDLERVIAAEADRFLSIKPPGGSRSDTKAEENGWNLICIVLAANMFPQHTNATAWHAKGIEYAMNTLSVAQDKNDRAVVDGKPVNEWVSTENVNPDFTLENHGIFHPSYVACSSYFLTQTAMYYKFAGRPIPQAASHHLLDTWRMLQPMLLPSAEPAYPQGMDWELHGLTLLNLYASLGAWKQDGTAARLEQISLQYMRAWQKMCNGDMAVPGSRLGFTRHAICAEQAAYGFLAHKIFGNPAQAAGPAEFDAAVSGLQHHKFSGFITERTGKRLVSVSWKNKIMGSVVPLGDDGDENPFFTVPLAGGLFGKFETKATTDTRSNVLNYFVHKTPDGFETTGTILLNGNSLEQVVSISSYGENVLVYQDVVTAQQDTSITCELGLPFGIENDSVSGGRRVVIHSGGETVFWQSSPQPPFAVPGRWASVDGRLGIVAVAGSGIVYRQAPGYDPRMGVCTDMLYGSFKESVLNPEKGQETARRIMVISTGLAPQKLARMAQTCRITETKTGSALQLVLPCGESAEVPLLR